MEILVTSAVEFEAAPTLNALERAGIRYEYLPFGIGCLNSAASADRIATAALNKNVVYLGSCGVFGDFDQPYFVTAGDVIWRPLAERLGLAYGIASATPDLKVDQRYNTFTNSLPRARVLCSPSISKDPTLDTRDQNLSVPLVENLELYSALPYFLKNCATFDVLLGVTNSIGPGAHEQWKSNFQTVAEKSAEYLLEYMNEIKK